MKRIVAIISLLLSIQVYAVDGVWLGADAKDWPQTDYRKTVNGFSGWLVVTTDRNWQQKLLAPRDVVLTFNVSDKVSLGEPLTILSFFVNPATDPYGNIEILCSMKTTRPDGSIAFDHKDVPCVKEMLIGKADDIRSSPMIIEFIGEPSDPVGVWTVEVSLYDRNRDTKVDLTSSFELTKDD